MYGIKRFTLGQGRSSVIGRKPEDDALEWLNNNSTAFRPISLTKNGNEVLVLYEGVQRPIEPEENNLSEPRF